jgi:endonuclease YncB( thermonuclease family)
MPPVIPFRRRSPVPIAVWAIASAVLAFAATTIFLNWESKLEPTVTIMGPDDPARPTTVTIIRPEKSIRREAGASAPIEVIDGDTVRLDGAVYRLSGFDTPESGDKAWCDDERRHAEQATSRLRELIAGGDARLVRIACSCPSGQKGTRHCNYGRLCGSLMVGGRDVGQILIGEGLAHPYVCGTTSCPKRRPWC